MDNDQNQTPIGNAQGQQNTQVQQQVEPTQPVVAPMQNMPVQQQIVLQPQTQVVPEPQLVQQSTSPVSVQESPMQELIDQVEKDLLSHIYTNLKENKISGVAAQELAKEFLALLPFKDKKDLVEKLSTLGQKYPEARQTYVNLGIPVEEQQRQERLDQMRAHIQSGDLDKALEVAKGGVQNGS